MKHPDLKIYFAVISHGRPDSVSEVKKYLGTSATWYVGHGEVETYYKAGAKNVKCGGDLSHSRNMALDDAWRQGVPCVQISDDLRRFSLATDRMQPLTALAAAMIVKANMDSVGDVYLGGTSSNSNPLMSIGLRTGNTIPPKNRPLISTNCLVLGDFSVVKPCGIYFDEKTLVKEDYEYTLRHLRTFGKVLRCNYVLSDFRHRTNPGGANLNREKYGAEKKAYDYLLERWKGVLSSRIKHGPTSSDYELQIYWKPEMRDKLPQVFPRFPRLAKEK